MSKPASNLFSRLADAVRELGELRGLPRPCPVCGGRGEIEDSGDPAVGYGPVIEECEDCDGTGLER
jgi:hypothetical protein